MTRNQLPPQIKKVAITERGTGKAATRYQLTVDAGLSAETGKRQQVRRRFKTEKEARLALAEIGHQASGGTFVARAPLTVEELCASYVSGKHRLRPSSRAKMLYDLGPLVERHGGTAVQRLRKDQLDQLVADLRAGGTQTVGGRTRRPWGPVAVNKFISTVSQVLGDGVRQGIVARNVAEYVDRVEVENSTIDTYSEAEVTALLSALSGDRLVHAWELALSGLRRGELAGLRWSDVDFDKAQIHVRNNRVSAGGRTVENAPKSAASSRNLPMPDRMVSVLKACRARQAAERLAIGSGGGAWEYVVSNEAGDPYSPAVLSRYWRDAVARAGVRHIKLHAARHTCATLMHLQGVPVALIAAWIGHKDASLTMRVYAHSQDEALKVAAASLNRVVTPRDIDAG